MKKFIITFLAALLGSLIAFAVFFLILIGLIGSLSSKTPTTIPSSGVLKIDFVNPIKEQSSESELSLLSLNLEEKSPIGIYNVVKSIEMAAEDPGVKFIYLNPEKLNIGLAQLEELRNALEKYKLSGKPIISYCNNYSQAGLYLCSVADKIYINKSGMGEMIGLSANMMFFKNLIDKVGIDVQLIKHGKFKAAAEQFVEQDISPANRLQNEEMLKSIWGVWTNAICKARNIDVALLNNWVDNIELLTASSFVEKGIIDEAVTTDKMSEIICNLAGVEKEKDVKFFSIKEYADAKIKKDIKIKDKIAVIYANGEITMDGREGISAKKYYPIIRDVAKDSSIKAVVLRVNSPGGDAQAAEIINNELQELRKNKPLVVSFADYAASGGYWISAKSDYIFTDATTITGSIGVFSLFFTYGDALKKQLDINTVSINTNTHSGMVSGTRPLNKIETEKMQLLVENIYDDFINLVAEGRDISKIQADSIGQGRVWTGEQAIGISLANSIGGLNDAIEYAKNLAGISEARINEYPTPLTQMEKFMEMLNETSNSAKILSNPKEFITETYNYLINNNNRMATFARLPYIYDIK